jgi:propanediol dehydratase large subunit
MRHEFYLKDRCVAIDENNHAQCLREGGVEFIGHEASSASHSRWSEGKKWR